jgi:hypothetical protein
MTNRLETPNLDFGQMPEWLEPDLLEALQHPEEDPIGAITAAAQLLRAGARLRERTIMNDWITQCVNPARAIVLAEVGLENAENVLSILHRYAQDASSLTPDVAHCLRADRDDAESCLYALGIAVLARKDGGEFECWEDRLLNTLVGCDEAARLVVPNMPTVENGTSLKAMQAMVQGLHLWWLN